MDETLINSASEENPLLVDPRPRDLRTADSLLVVNTGHGKGKSTAAFGIALRGLAQSWRIAVVQFIKSGDWSTGEEKVGRQMGIEWFALGDGFTWDSKRISDDQKTAENAWTFTRSLISENRHELIILDELTYLMTWKWIQTKDVVSCLSGRPGAMNIVITGRDAPQEILDIADTVTEMKNIKHAYEKGVRAKRGIDY